MAPVSIEPISLDPLILKLFDGRWKHFHNEDLRVGGTKNSLKINVTIATRNAIISFKSFFVPGMMQRQPTPFAFPSFGWTAHAFSLRTLSLDRVNSTAIKTVHTNYNNQTTQLTRNRLPTAQNLVIDSSSAPRRIQAKSRKRRTRMTTTRMSGEGRSCQSTGRGVSTPFEKSDKIRTGQGKGGRDRNIKMSQKAKRKGQESVK